MTTTWRISLLLPRIAATGCGAARAWLAGHHYPSVRREGGTFIACFRPSVVADVCKSTRYRRIWAPLRARFVRQDTA
jgi:hypothetical protein